MNSFFASIPTFCRCFRAIFSRWFWTRVASGTARIFPRWLWTRIAFGTACIVTAWGVFCAVERLRWKREWHAYETQARDRGARLDVSEFPVRTVADADNFSAIPFFQDYYREPMPPDGLSGHVFESLIAFAFVEHWTSPPATPAERVGALVRSRSEPPRRMRKDGTAISENVWITARRMAPGDGVPEMSNAMLKLLDQECGGIWEQLLGAIERPDCRFSAVWADGLDPNRDRPIWPFLRMRKAAQLAGIRLTLHTAAGNGEGALDDLAVALRLSRAMEKEPSLVSAMINIAMVQLATSGVWNGLAGGVWDEKHLERVDELLRGIDLVSVYRYGMETERAFTNSMFRQFSSGDYSALRYFYGHKGFKFPMEMYPAGWVYRSEVKVNQFYDRVISRADPVRHTLVLDPETDRVVSASGAFREKLVLLVVPGFHRSGARTVAVEALLRQARAACGLERYRLRHGGYPEGLEILVNERLIPAVPRDPVNDAPMEYRRLEDGRYALKAAEANRVSQAAGVVDSQWPDAWMPGSIR
jgi:hypothetical protein